MFTLFCVILIPWLADTREQCTLCIIFSRKFFGSIIYICRPIHYLRNNIHVPLFITVGVRFHCGLLDFKISLLPSIYLNVTSSVCITNTSGQRRNSGLKSGGRGSEKKIRFSIDKFNFDFFQAN